MLMAGVNCQIHPFKGKIYYALARNLVLVVVDCQNERNILQYYKS